MHSNKQNASWCAQHESSCVGAGGEGFLHIMHGSLGTRKAVVNGSSQTFASFATAVCCDRRTIGGYRWTIGD